MLLKNLPNRHILDIGCHIGSIAKRYADAAEKITFLISKYLGHLFPFKYMGVTTILKVQKL